MSLTELLLILHILGAILFGGGILATGGLWIAGRGSTSTRRLALVLDLQRKAGLFGTVLGAILAILFGSWLVAEIDYEFSEGWISASYTLWIVALVLGPAVLGRHARRVGKRAEELAAAGTEESEELRGEYNAPMVGAVILLLHLILLAFLYLMVARPGS